MSFVDILKDSEIFNEINYSSGEDSCSENESKALLKKKVSPRKKYVINKKAQPDKQSSGYHIESTKTRKTEETQQTER